MQPGKSFLARKARITIRVVALCRAHIAVWQAVVVATCDTFTTPKKDAAVFVAPVMKLSYSSKAYDARAVAVSDVPKSAPGKTVTFAGNLSTLT